MKTALFTFFLLLVSQTAIFSNEQLDKLVSSITDIRRIEEPKLYVGESKSIEVQKLINERVEEINTIFFLTHENFQIEEIKVVGKLATVILSAYKIDNEVLCTTIPLCCVEINNEWKVAPMICNFKFVDLIKFDASKEATSLMKWCSQTTIDKQIDVSEKAVEQLKSNINNKRAELNKTCETPKEVVEYFLKQVDDKSLAGLCAVSGYGLDVKYANELAFINLVKSIQVGMNVEVSKRGGWNLFTDPKKKQHFLQIKEEFKKEDRELEHGDDIYVLFYNESSYETLVLVPFKIVLTQRGYYIDLSSDLFLANGVIKQEFRQKGFSKWNVSQNTKLIAKKLPEYLSASLKAEKFDTAEKAISKTKEIYEKKENFFEFLSCFSFHTPGNEISDLAELNGLALKWRNSKYYLDDFPVFDLPIIIQADGNKALHIRAYLSQRLRNISYEFEFYRFEKGEEGWKAHGKLHDVWNNEDYAPLLNTVAGSVEELVKVVDKELKAVATLFDKNSIRSEEALKEADVKALLNSYLAALVKKDTRKVLSMSVLLRMTNEIWKQEYLAETSNFRKEYDITINKVYLAEKGFAAVLVDVKGERGDAEQYLYGVLNLDGKLYVDRDNNDLYGNSGPKENSLSGFMSRFKNAKKYSFIETHYSGDYAIFLKDTCQKINKEE